MSTDRPTNRVQFLALATERQKTCVHVQVYQTARCIHCVIDEAVHWLQSGDPGVAVAPPPTECDQCGQKSTERVVGARCPSLPFGSCDGTMVAAPSYRMPPCATCGHPWAVHVVPGGVENLDVYPHERHCVDCGCRNYRDPVGAVVAPRDAKETQ